MGKLLPTADSQKANGEGKEAKKFKKPSVLLVPKKSESPYVL